MPGVESQAWSSNYRDGYCGIRKLNDDFNITDPNLANFVPVARNTCSNIADNPFHETMQVYFSFFMFYGRSSHNSMFRIN